MIPDPDSWADHMHRLTELHREMAAGTVPPDEARARLAKLSAEQQEFMKLAPVPDKFNQAHNIVQKRMVEQKEERMRQLRKRPRIMYHSMHVLDFKCQCKVCVRKHTITMEDRNLLREMGIIWNKAEDGVVDSPSQIQV